MILLSLGDDPANLRYALIHFTPDHDYSLDPLPLFQFSRLAWRWLIATCSFYTIQRKARSRSTTPSDSRARLLSMTHASDQ